MRLLAFIFVLICTRIFGQVESTPLLSGSCSMTQTGSGTGFWLVEGNLNDATGLNTAEELAVGDILYFTDSGIGYHLPITEVVSGSGSSFEIKVNNTGVTGVVGVPSVQGAIYRPTPNLRLPGFVSGLSNADQQTLIAHLTKLIDTEAETTTVLNVGSATATITYRGAIPTFTSPSTGVYRLTLGATTKLASTDFFFDNSHTDGSGNLGIQIYSSRSIYWKPQILAKDTDMIVEYEDRSVTVSQTILSGLGTLTSITGFNSAFGSDGAVLIGRF